MRERSDCILDFSVPSKSSMFEVSSNIENSEIECESVTNAFKSSRESRDSKWRN